MPVSVFTTNSVTSGDEVLDVVVSGISGSVYFFRYELNFTATDAGSVQCDVTEPDSSFTTILSDGEYFGGGTYTHVYEPPSYPNTYNGTHEFDVTDTTGFGFAGLDVNWAKVVVTHLGSTPTGLGDELIWYCPSQLDDSTDLSTLTDISGNKTHATKDGIDAADYVSDTGESGTLAIDLDGSSERAYTQADVSLGSSFCYSAWIKLDSTSGNKCILSKRESTHLVSNVFYVTGGGLLGRVWDSSSSNYRGRQVSGLMSTGTWYHVAMTWDGTDVKLYLDGVQVDDTDSSAGSFSSYVDDSYPVRIGHQNTTAGLLFDGRIDDVRVFSDVPSSSELTHLASQRGVTGGPTSPPVSIDPQDIDSQAESESPSVSIGFSLGADDLDSQSQVDGGFSAGFAYIASPQNVRSFTRVSRPDIGFSVGTVGQDIDCSSECSEVNALKIAGLSTSSISSATQCESVLVTSNRSLQVHSTECDVEVSKTSFGNGISVLSMNIVTHVERPAIPNGISIDVPSVESGTRADNSVTLTGVTGLVPEDIESSSECSRPSSSFSIVAYVRSLDSHSAVESFYFDATDIAGPESITAAPECSEPSIGKGVQLVVHSNDSQSEVESPDVASLKALQISDVDSPSVVSDANVTATKEVLAVSIDAASEVDRPVLVTNALAVVSIESGSELKQFALFDRSNISRPTGLFPISDLFPGEY